MATVGLPMYDLPELRAATDSWWAGLARALRCEGIGDVPDRLTRGHFTEAIWMAPDLLLSQACGYDIIGEHRDRLAYVATPRYATSGCEGTRYSSHIVVAANAPAECLEDLRGKRCVINGYTSHSGCNALRREVAPLAQGGRFFGSVAVSGSHMASLEMVLSGQADVAAIDCIVYALLARYRPHLVADIRIIARTLHAPVGPYVTRAGAPVDFMARLRAGLMRATADPGLAAAREDLLIGGFDVLEAEEYRRIAEVEAEAARLGYRDFERTC